MSISSYSLSFKKNDTDIKTKQNSILPDQDTYKKVREYAGLIKSQIEKGIKSEFTRTLPLREFSTYFKPEWWTKLTVDNHYIIEQKCVRCGTCVLCFGCINNCEYQAVNMESDNKKLISFHEYMEKNNLKFVLPNELKS